KTGYRRLAVSGAPIHRHAAVRALHVRRSNSLQVFAGRDILASTPRGLTHLPEPVVLVAEFLIALSNRRLRTADRAHRKRRASVIDHVHALFSSVSSENARLMLVHTVRLLRM